MGPSKSGAGAPLGQPGAEVRPECGEGLAAVPDVVVDDVEDHRHLLPVRSVDKPREPLRPAVDGVGRRVEHAVVAPATGTGEGRDGHQLDRRHAQLAKPGQPGRDRSERALRREGADVELVENELVDRPSGPAAVVPGKRPRIDDLRRAADAERLGTRARIGQLEAVVEDVPVEVACRCRDGRREDAVAGGGERERALVEPDSQRCSRRGPDPELDEAGSGGDRAELALPRRGVHASTSRRGAATAFNTVAWR